MSEYEQAFELAMSFFQDKVKAELWMDSANPLLGYLVPNDMIAMGRGDKLIEGMKCMLEGEFP